MSKLAPRLIKYTLISYFRRSTYKLWDQASGTTIKSCDVIFKEGYRHCTISNMPTAVIDTAFDDNTLLATPHNTDATPGSIVVAPKPLARQPQHTDPPLHPDTMMPITPVATPVTPIPPPDAPPPTILRQSAHLAVLGSSAPQQDTTALLTTLPDSQVPHSYWEAMTQPDLWMPAMETEWAVLKERGVFELVDAHTNVHVIE